MAAISNLGGTSARQADALVVFAVEAIDRRPDVLSGHTDRPAERRVEAGCYETLTIRR